MPSGVEFKALHEGACVLSAVDVYMLCNLSYNA